MKRFFILASVFAMIACTNNKYSDQIQTIKEVTEYDVKHVGKQCNPVMTDLYIDGFISRCNERVHELNQLEGKVKDEKTLNEIYECINVIDESIDYALTFASDDYINNGI
jgi:hypothetical protein